MEKAAFVLLGWLLATLSPVIADAIRKRRRRADSRKVVLAELAELKYRLSVVAYYCEMRYGNPDRPYLEKLRPVLEAYTGPMAVASVKQKVDMLLAMSDQQIQAVAEVERGDPSASGLSLKKYPVPFLDMRLKDVEALPDLVQPLLLEIHTQLGMLDQEAENAQYYFRLTFDSSLTGDNRDRVEGNLTQAYRQYANVARTIVKRIGELEALWK
ncbi:MAG: hypothetical protein KIS74_01175 [Burkholderiales bacterium]|nr:hypothetical protein [Burkholderiales bacterium]